jgi:hypothetical protein
MLVKASERTVSSLVHTLSSVHADWNDLSPTLQSAFIKRMKNQGNSEQQEERKSEQAKPQLKDGTNMQSKKQHKDKVKESHTPQNQTLTDVNRSVVVFVNKEYKMSNMTSGSNITNGVPVKHGRL